MDYIPLKTPDECDWVQLIGLTCIYGYILFNGANLIGDGSELLLLLPAWKDVIGSIVLPVLGAIPDGLMVLFSGLGNDAQQQVSVGIGALAGSTIMLLTVPWFLAILGGRVSVNKDGAFNYISKPKLRAADVWHLTRCGVRVENTIRSNVLWVLATSLL